MARNKILIERGRLVVTDHGGVVLKAQTSKKYAGRIDVHLEGFVAHMDYDQAKAEFKKVGVNVESFEQAFSRLKKNPGRMSPNMMGRILEERQLLGDGWKTEWEPARLPDSVPTALANPNTEKEWRALVRYLNDRMKREGNNIQYRSVEDPNW